MIDTSNFSKKEKLLRLPKAKRQAFFNSLTDDEILALETDIEFIGRPNQQLPNGDWQNWLVLAGRSFGKTFMGAHCVNRWAREHPGCRMAILGETTKDVRDYNIYGVSGIMKQSHPDFKPIHIASKCLLEWPNGSQAITYTAQEPEAFRGGQFHFAWLDELAKYQYQDEIWAQLDFCMRLGDNPQMIITTTPRPTPLIKEIARDPYTTLTTGTTFDNNSNLPPGYLKKLKDKYEGTRLGKQELYAAILEDNPNAMFDLANFNEFRHNKDKMPILVKIAVGVDPAITAHANSDETGIIVAGYDVDGHGYILEDLSMVGKPSEWAKVVVAAYHRWQANFIVAEVNQGGDMVETIIRNEDKNVAYKAVRATKGKVLRGEPIAALYEQGRIHHVGLYNTLEDQMANFDPTMVHNKSKSPDRLDALVWVLTLLFNLDLIIPKITVF